MENETETVDRVILMENRKETNEIPIDLSFATLCKRRPVASKMQLIFGKPLFKANFRRWKMNDVEKRKKEGNIFEERIKENIGEHV